MGAGAVNSGTRLGSILQRSAADLRSSPSLSTDVDQLAFFWIVLEPVKERFDISFRHHFKKDQNTLFWAFLKVRPSTAEQRFFAMKAFTVLRTILKKKTIGERFCRDVCLP